MKNFYFILLATIQPEILVIFKFGGSSIHIICAHAHTQNNTYVQSTCISLYVRTYVHTRMNVDHILLGRGLSSINYVSLYLRRSHLNLTDLNLTVASSTAKLPNLIDRQYFRLYSILEPWVEYCSHNFLEIFCSTSFCRKRGYFSPLIAFVAALSGFGVRRAWLQRDVRKGTLNTASSIKQRAVRYYERQQQRFWRSQPVSFSFFH